MASKHKRLTLSVAIAFAIVAVVFIFGYFYDSSKISYLSTNLNSYEQSVNELELATLLTTTNSTFSCSILTNNLYSIASEMQNLGRQLTASDLANSIANYNQLNDQRVIFSCEEGKFISFHYAVCTAVYGINEHYSCKPVSAY